MVRVLLCGDLRGRIQQLADQVAKLHAKLSPDQHFQAVFCVGEFSAEDHVQVDTVPGVPVYFIDAGPAAGKLISDKPQGGEISPGVHFLGHYGVTRVAGLSVAFLSGRARVELFAAPPVDVEKVGEEAAAQGQSWEELRAAEKLAEVGKKELFVDGHFYTPLAVERLNEEIADSGGVDLLLTSEWPSGCLRGVPKEARQGLDKAVIQTCSSTAVAEIVAAAEPKYHAVGLGGVFWRRPPWSHVHRGEVVASTGEMRCGVCRLIALGANEVPSKQKSLHGLDLDPHALPTPAADATPSPWAAAEKAPTAEGGVTSAAPGDVQPLRPVFESGDREEQRRWMQRFGVRPQEMLSASDKVAKEAEPKEKKEKRQSLYYNQKGEKRFKAGKGGHEGFLQKERRAANGKSVGSYF